ncbi:uvrC [Acrasis kona]|uniref:UvrC n=1 Tax=Acrasis kona TaxID=1008807 RepID=A0AAW2ZLB0_9EUKA
MNYLKESSHKQLQILIKTALGFFDDDNVSIHVFYLTKRSRMNIKVRSDKFKAWLKITFEYGFPKQQVTNGWFTKQKMLELITQQ